MEEKEQLHEDISKALDSMYKILIEKRKLYIEKILPVADDQIPVFLLCKSPNGWTIKCQDTMSGVLKFVLKGIISDWDNPESKKEV